MLDRLLYERGEILQETRGVCYATGFVTILVHNGSAAAPQDSARSMV